MRIEHSSLNNRKMNVGGWSTSMGDLMDDPRRKSNCCALTCCGVFLYDRTRYLVTGNRPNWRLRRIIYVFVPLALLLAIFFAGIFHIDEGVDDSDAVAQVVVLLQIAFVVYLVFLCIYNGREHGDLRQAVHQKLRESKRGEGGDDDDDTGEPSPDDFVMLRKPVGCCSCYPVDVVVVEGNCCGMCATGQEDRELELVLQKEGNAEALHIDYITFQPYSDYYPKIQELQSSGGGSSFRNHFSALSELSQKILRYAAYVIALVCATYLLLPSPDNHGVIKIAITLGVWAQPCVILYFVWWKYHRFDISLDAIVKYFATGYITGVFQAGLVESLLIIPYSLFSIVVLLIEVGNETDDMVTIAQDTFTNTGFMAQLLKDNLGVNAVIIFGFSFGVVALVEEMVKYYCFWTVEMPEQLDAPNQSKKSQANYITIGMVSAALGFASKENMQYVFQSQDVKEELLTFFLRSILAVHPVCAAIQSVGIVNRDVMGDPSWSLGRSLLPAIVLHGLFDFAELIVAYYLVIDELDVGELLDPTIAEANTETLVIGQIVQQAGVGAVVMVGGLVYYAWIARQQRKCLGLADEDDAEMTSLELNPIA
eukprot:jgi/Psemu1/283589/fgenesh1_pg.30_\